MKIKSVKANNRKRAFEIATFNGSTFEFPYSQLKIAPTKSDPIAEVVVDQELDKEAFTYALESGKCDTVHVDHVRHYEAEPTYLRELLLHKLSVQAKKVIRERKLRQGELTRRLNTSPAHFARLVDPTKSAKSIDKLIELLVACDCDVDVTINGKSLMAEEALQPA